MSLREGYKETEIGIIPEDWKLSNLKDLVLDMHQGINTVTENIKYHDTGIDILQAKHITSGYIDFSDPRKVSNEDYVKYKDKYQPKLNHILLTNIGTIGKVILVREKINFLIAWNLFLIKSNEQMINPNFLLNFFKKLDSEKYYDRFLTGNATKFINKKFMGDIKIPLPPLEEQKKIADILSTIDQKIDLIDTQINDTGVLKKGLMQKLLTQGIGHSEFKESEIGRIPVGWEVKTFGDILTVKYGKNQKQVEDPNGLYPILGTGGLMGYANKFLYNKPSVLIGRKGTIDKPQYMDTPFWTVDTLFYTEINADIDPKWLFQKFRTIDWKKHNEASGVPSLSVANIQRIIVSIPSQKEQKQIAQILSVTDEKLSSLREKKEAFEELKKGLMQKLLTGEERV